MRRGSLHNIRWTTLLLVPRNPFGNGYFRNRRAIGSEMTRVFTIYQSFPAASFMGLLSLCPDIHGLRCTCTQTQSIHARASAA